MTFRYDAFLTESHIYAHFYDKINKIFETNLLTTDSLIAQSEELEKVNSKQKQ